MNREQYIKELVSKLSRMKPSDREEAIRYYEEYFDEAGADQEEAVIRDLGSPEQVAKQILADYAVREVMKAPKSPKKNINAIWLIVLAILASPIAFPLALAAISVIFALVVASAACVFALGVTLFAVGTAGAGVFVGGISLLTSNIATAMTLIGPGLVMMGMTLLVLVLVTTVIMKGTPVMIACIHRIMKRLAQRGDKR